MVIQELWKKGVTWDEILETSLQKQLGLWWGEATQLGELHFPRWIEFMGEPIVVHLFTDASEKAYGYAIYAMVGLKSFLLFAKAKVASVKSQPLARLELQAAFKTEIWTHSKCIASGERAVSGFRTEKQKIVCVRVIALLAMSNRDTGKCMELFLMWITFSSDTALHWSQMNISHSQCPTNKHKTTWWGCIVQTHFPSCEKVLLMMLAFVLPYNTKSHAIAVTVSPHHLSLSRRRCQTSSK